MKGKKIFHQFLMFAGVLQLATAGLFKFPISLLPFVVFLATAYIARDEIVQMMAGVFGDEEFLEHERKREEEDNKKEKKGKP